MAVILASVWREDLPSHNRCAVGVRFWAVFLRIWSTQWQWKATSGFQCSGLPAPFSGATTNSHM